MIHTEFINLLHLYFPESTCLWEIEQNQVQISQRNCVKMYILGIYTNAQPINERNTRAAFVNDSSLWFLNIYYFISCQLHCSGKEILAGKVNRELNRVNLFSWMTTHIRRKRQIKKEILLTGKNISKSVLAFNIHFIQAVSVLSKHEPESWQCPLNTFVVDFLKIICLV